GTEWESGRNPLPAWILRAFHCQVNAPPREIPKDPTCTGPARSRYLRRAESRYLFLGAELKYRAAPSTTESRETWCRMMPADRYLIRRQKLVKYLKDQHVRTLLISNETNVSYLTGFTGDSSYLLLN